MLKKTLIKISAVFIITCFFTACNVVKRVEASDYLLTENNFFINGQKKKSEELTNLSFQKKNAALLGIPLRLHIYNLARSYKDSIFDRIISIERGFTALLKTRKYNKVAVFLSLIKQYLNEPLIVKTESFFEKVEGSFDWVGAEFEDLQERITKSNTAPNL